MAGERPPEMQQQAAAKFIIASASYVSATIDGVSNWLAVGLGAILAFIVGNIDKLKPYIDINKIKLCVFLYIVILLIVLIQKRLTIMIASANRGNALAREIISTSGEGEFNPNVVRQEYIDATYWPRKWELVHTFKMIQIRAESGDHVWAARRLARAAQRQEWYVFLQAIITIFIVYLLAIAIK